MYDKDMLQKILLEPDCRTINESGQLHPPSHFVYQRISERMTERGSEITPKHIYTILHANRNGFRSMVDAKWTTDTSADVPLAPSESKEVKLVISPKTWETMKPVKKLYSRWSFPAGWTKIIREALAEEEGIECEFAFKHHTVNPSSNSRTFASFDGQCVKCSAAIRGRLEKEPDVDVDVTFECEISSIRKEHHAGVNQRRIHEDLVQGPIPMFRNGGRVIFDGKNYNVINTCGFDSLFQIFVCGLNSLDNYREQVVAKSIPVLDLAMSILNNKDITVENYSQRGRILLSLNLFRDAVTVSATQVHTLDAVCNVGQLAEDLFSGFPSLHRRTSCDDCGHKSSRSITLLPINVDVISNNGLASMQEAIDGNELEVRQCEKCQKMQKNEIEYGPHILIDSAVVTNEYYTGKKNTQKYKLDELPATLTVGNAAYELIGLVHYRQGSPGHYVALHKSGHRWTKYDDVKTAGVALKGDEPIFPHFIVYMVSETASS